MMIKIKKIEQNPMKAAKETKEEVMAEILRHIPASSKDGLYMSMSSIVKR